jgi:hypothetical protein
MPPTPQPDQPTADQCEQIFHAALAKGDTEGVEAALVGLALRDPHRAQDLLDITRVCLKVAADPTLRDTVMAALQPEPTADRSIADRGDYVLVTFLVTRDGERGHPMDTIATRIDVDAGGGPANDSLERLTERVRREVQRKARTS